jgi:hypothetical protein
VKNALLVESTLKARSFNRAPDERQNELLCCFNETITFFVDEL